MLDVTLNAATRLAPQTKTGPSSGQPARATSTRLGSHLDGATTDFTSKSLAARSASAAEAMTRLASASGALSRASENLGKIGQFIGALKAADREALRAPDGAAQRKAFVEAYDAFRTEIDALAGAASYDAVNLLKGDDLDVGFTVDPASETKTTIKGVTFDAEGLGLGAVAGDDLSEPGSLDAAFGAVDAAHDRLAAQAQVFGRQLTAVDARRSFNAEFAEAQQAGLGALTAADLTEEGATLTSLRTREMLTTRSLAISTARESGALQLFR